METGDVNAMDEFMYYQAAEIEAKAKETQSDAKDKMEDGESPRMVADGTAANINATTDESRRIADENSIFVGDLEYDATEAELKAFFARCGEIRRVTIRARAPKCAFEF